MYGAVSRAKRQMRLLGSRANLAAAAMFLLASVKTGMAQAPLVLPHRIIESYPIVIEQSIKEHDHQVSIAGHHVGAVPYYLIVPTHRRWQLGQTLHIAFNGGDDQLYSKIEQAASVWVAPGAANLKFEFKDAAGHYLKWTAKDKSYVGEIRIAFASGDSGGYWSLVGTDSKDPTIFGGRSSQASMNFEGFATVLPSDWQGIVRHEFGHALGFEHEHQSPAAECDFRFYDDLGYVKTKDQDGWYTTDSKGKRPGLYTYLGGKANFWPNSKVDSNLKNIATTSAFMIGTFDKLSIMKYYFDSGMFKLGGSSPCYTAGENEVLSSQDLAGVSAAYSSDPKVASLRTHERLDLLSQLRVAPGLSPSFIRSMNARLTIAQ